MRLPRVIHDTISPIWTETYQRSRRLSCLIDATADRAEPRVNIVDGNRLSDVPGDGGVIEVADGVVGRVMETSGGRALRVDPVAAVSVPGPGVGVVTGKRGNQNRNVSQSQV